MAVTMKQIADMVGVSRTAVSAVLNNKYNCRIAPAKRDRIIQVAKELNYKTNYAALQLLGKPSENIAIISGSTMRTIQSEFFGALNNKLIKHGFQNYYGMVSDSDSMEKTISALSSRGIDGIITAFIEFDFEKERKIPLINVAGSFGRNDVMIDLEHGAYIATKHLIEHGHRRIGFVGIGLNNNSAKVRGFKRAMTESDLPCTDEFILEIMHNKMATDKILSLCHSKKITAMLASNDYIGGKLMVFLRHHGLRVPEDIAIIGFDGMSFCEFTLTPLTTIIQPISKMAQVAFDLLMNKKEQATSQETVLIKPELYIGSSCGCKKHNYDMIYWGDTMPILEELAYNVDEAAQNR